MSVTLGDVIVYLRANNAGFDSTLNDAENKSRNFAGRVGKVLGGLAVGGVLAATGAVAGLGVAAFRSAEELDEAYDIIQTKTGATGAELDKLQDDFRTVFADVPTDAQSAAEVIAILNDRLGEMGDETVYAAENILDASRLMGGDAVTNTELLTRVMGDWGIEGENAYQVMDKIFAASQATGAGMEDLMQRVVQFGAPLRLMGFSFEDSLALFGKWEAEGVNSELVMGSLRIAAGHFAKATGEAGDEVGKAAEETEKHATKLEELRAKLALAQKQQGEFNAKTKESTKLAKQQQIDKLTKQIAQEEKALASLAATTSNEAVPTAKSLRESLLETFNSIKNNTDGAAALAEGMEVFGARAGPDMVAAIREGRFEFEDMAKALDVAGGSISRTAEATEDWPEKWSRLKQNAMLTIAPIGDVFRDVAGTVLDVASPMIISGLQSITEFTRTELPKVGQYIGELKTAYDQGGLAGLGAKIGADVGTLWGTYVAPEISTWPGKFWEWLTGKYGAINAGAFLMLHRFAPQLAYQVQQVWPGIQAEISTWPGKFWEWLTGKDGAISQATAKLNELSASFSEWVNSPETQTALTNLGEEMGRAIGNRIVGLFGGEDGDQWIQDVAATMFDTAERNIDAFTNIGATIEAGIITGLIEALTGKEVADSTAAKIKEVLQEIVKLTNPAAIGIELFNGIWEPFSNAWKAAISLLKGEEVDLSVSDVLPFGITSLLPTFASGGVVPGPVGGPAQLAMVHPGEVILNPEQQAEFGGQTNIQNDNRVYIQTLNLNGVQNVSAFLAELEALT